MKRKLDYFIFTGNSADHSFILIDRSKLYGLGNNELGIGEETEDPKEPITIIPFFTGKRVRNVYVGGTHSMAIVDEYLYAWGLNSFGQLGIGTKKNAVIPTLVPFFNDKTITDIHLGYDHSLAIVDKSLFGWGDNYLGQLGMKHVKKKLVPTKLDFFEGKSVDKVVVGPFHNMVLIGKEIWGWGMNLNGQLGIGCKENQYDPVRIPFTPSVINIFLGGSHSIFLSDNNRLYVCGRSFSGELGIGLETIGGGDCITPVLNDFFCLLPSIKNIYLGWHHSLVLLNDGSVYGFGENNYNQLEEWKHIPARKKKKLSPFKAYTNVVRIFKGKEHSFILYDDKSIFVCGDCESSTHSFDFLEGKEFYDHQYTKNKIAFCIIFSGIIPKEIINKIIY